MAEIRLTQGLVALVDDEDLHLVSHLKWRAQRASTSTTLFYAVHAEWIDGRLIPTSMHRLILPDAPRIDHINGNGVDNRRANLRSCTHAENMRNRKRSVTNQSGFKGVYWHKEKGRWAAQINAFNKRHRLGLFRDPVEAARAYDAAAIELHGEFARLNFPRV